jgi:PAS domain S-box-containing protein
MNGKDKASEKLLTELSELRQRAVEIEAMLAATGPQALDLHRTNEVLENEITETKGVEESSGERNGPKRYLDERNDLILDSISDSVTVIDVHDFRIIDANRAFLDKYNLRRKDLGEATCYQITHQRFEPCAPPNDPCPLMETVKTGRMSSSEHIHLEPNGKKIFVEVATYPIFDESDELVSVVHISRDITERKKARRAFQELENKKTLEKELLNERNQLQQILDSLPDGIIVFDGNNRLEWANARFKEITGLEPEGLIINGEIVNHFHDTTEGADEPGYISPIVKAKETGEPVQFIHSEPGDEASQRYFRIIITPFFDKEGNLNRIVETVRPITDIVLQRRQIDESEQRFRQFLENTRDMITIKDLNGRYLVINQPAAALFGKTPMDCIGLTDHEIMPRALADRLVHKDQEALNKKEYLVDKVTLHIYGEIHYIDIVHFPLFDYKGDVTGICSIGRDATEQNQLQKMLIQSEKMAAVGKLASSVAHEINNPLTGILTFGEMLKIDALDRDPQNPVIRDYDVIIHEAIRCREIVSELLDYARLEQPRRRPMNINTAIERSVGLVKKQAAFHNIEFENDMADSLPKVQCDPTQMQQVFLNLIINARESIDGAGKIKLSSRLSDDGRFVEGRVTDNGPGISPDIIDNIFEHFYSTKGSRGTGQGLSVVQAIVERQGGMIKVDSQEGKGATFTVSIPVPLPDRQEKGVHLKSVQVAD